ncbi:hypothetical protein BV22DRAFT_1133969 [Leucogyrophana mollusca]|uniref:Uncharacterized protein n=1 Tax=Leucogyrophana mollusca TaxID=85980 RepID=A0ACB8B162_9AGAM|nr:hypothetical protein BV22DRAFT_1133969 [Leucogyrophana mollusca]
MTSKRPHSPPDSPPSQASRARVSEAPKLTLTSVSDDIDPRTHIAMDESVFATFGGGHGPHNPTQVALLLSVITITSDNILDQQYSDIKAGLQLLRELPELEAELKTAWKARSFRSIRYLQILRPSNVKSESSEQMSPPPDPHVVHHKKPVGVI